MNMHNLINMHVEPVLLQPYRAACAFDDLLSGIAPETVTHTQYATLSRRNRRRRRETQLNGISRSKSAGYQHISAHVLADSSSHQGEVPAWQCQGRVDHVTASAATMSSIQQYAVRLLFIKPVEAHPLGEAYHNRLALLHGNYS